MLGGTAWSRTGLMLEKVTANQALNLRPSWCRATGGATGRILAVETHYGGEQGRSVLSDYSKIGHMALNGDAVIGFQEVLFRRM